MPDGIDLRTRVELQLHEQSRKLERQSLATKDAARILRETCLDTATYKVDLISRWSDEGEENVSGRYKGPIPQAIALAEAEFLKLNNRTDVQAEYKVAICLGEIDWPLDRTYWEEHMLRNRADKE